MNSAWECYRSSAPGPKREVTALRTIRRHNLQSNAHPAAPPCYDFRGSNTVWQFPESRQCTRSLFSAFLETNVMNALSTAFQVPSMTSAMPLLFALVLLVILVISFRSRAVVFCQYLQAMTGIKLKPSEVRRVFKLRGKNGVREMFLDLIIREDLKEGPLDVPDVIAPGDELDVNARRR